MSTVFINATQARRDTRNNSVIHAEVRSIEQAVLANVSAGVLFANVSANTTMTTSNVYYFAHTRVSNDATVIDQLETVKGYFTHLGYGVNITTMKTQPLSSGTSAGKFHLTTDIKFAILVEC
jgi:hypothetical protein